MEDCRACAWDGYCIPDECIGIQKSAGTCANRIPAKKNIPTTVYHRKRVTTMDYTNFIQSKMTIDASHGLQVPVDQLTPALFDFQRDIVHWALARVEPLFLRIAGWGKR